MYFCRVGVVLDDYKSGGIAGKEMWTREPAPARATWPGGGAAHRSTPKGEGVVLGSQLRLHGAFKKTTFLTLTPSPNPTPPPKWG